MEIEYYLENIDTHLLLKTIKEPFDTLIKYSSAVFIDCIENRLIILAKHLYLSKNYIFSNSDYRFLILVLLFDSC